jgi:S-layer protein
MAYTYDQLVLAYTAAHDGIGPDAATQANFLVQAVLSANGQLTDAQLLSNIVNSADNTTGLAVLAYQFFTGKSPTKAGIDYLVNSSVNTGDLNDPYYSKFNIENRYINFAANLGVQGEGAANFAAKYGSLSFGDYVASIYQTIIGGSYAQAAGIDPAKAIADIIARKDAILATAQGAGMIPANATQAQIDIALKAATAGYLLGEAIKADVGLYAAAANNFMVAVAQGTATYNTDITYTYQPSVNTPSHGTGHVLDNAPAVLPVPTPPPPTTTQPAGPAAPATVFTTGTDSFTTGNNALVYTATLGGGTPTLTANDSLHGAGNTLNITDITTGSQDVLPTGLSLTGVSALNLTTAGNAGASASLLDLRITGLNTFTLHSSGTTNGEFLRGGTVALTLDSHAPTIQVLSGFGSLDITDNNLTGATALSLAGAGGAVTLHDPTGAAALTVSMNALTLTGGFTDADNRITSLTLAGTANLSTIDAITDTALTTLTATGKVVLGSSSAPIALGANVTTVNLSGDTDTAGVNYFTLGSNNVAFKVAADTTVINMGAHTGLTIAFGSITSGLSNSGPVGTGGPIPSGGHTGTAFVDDLLTAVFGVKDIEYGNDGTNTYIVESDNGSFVQGNGFVRVVEIIGIHSVTLDGGGGFLIIN